MADTKIKRALISVSDKRGLKEFATCLTEFGVRILSTGGTATTIRDADIAATDVSQYTNFPEIMGGRVKTLHPLVHGGILADREDEKHVLAMESNSIGAIDLVAVHLYPFQETVEANASYEKCIEEIDIGGVALLRAAAKNHKYVTVITDPDQYEYVMADMKENQGSTSLELRRYLAETAFVRSANYDANISRWFAANNKDTELFAKRFFLTGKRNSVLRYGENPQQQAAFYRTSHKEKGMAAVQQIQGKELSYNNINDASAAFSLACDLDDMKKPACVIVKHANPCGVALGKSVADAYIRARSCDPVSAFGGIVAINGTLDDELAEAILSNETGLFLEVLMAVDIQDGVLEKLLKKKPQLRVLLTGGLWDVGSQDDVDIKTVAGGFLVQQKDLGKISSPQDCQVVSARQPDAQQWDDMLFAWKIVKKVRSNAIVLAKDLVTVGMCGGQTSRVGAVNFAALKSAEHLGSEGSVLASDAFFPFADGIQAAHKAGVECVIQSGGSINDEEVIRVADEKNMILVMSGLRHFCH